MVVVVGVVVVGVAVALGTVGVLTRAGAVTGWPSEAISEATEDAVWSRSSSVVESYKKSNMEFEHNMISSFGFALFMAT